MNPAGIQYRIAAQRCIRRNALTLKLHSFNGFSSIFTTFASFRRRASRRKVSEKRSLFAVCWSARTCGKLQVWINIITRWWFQLFCFFHPYLGKWSNLTNIFQMGWNHQLVISFWYYDMMYFVNCIHGTSHMTCVQCTRQRYDMCLSVINSLYLFVNIYIYLP